MSRPISDSESPLRCSPPNCDIAKRELGVEQAKGLLGAGVVSCLNPSHKASIDVMQSRFGITVEIPPKAPNVALQDGDRLVVMGVSGLPRLEGRHEYTPEEVEGAKFTFSLFTVSSRHLEEAAFLRAATESLGEEGFANLRALVARLHPEV